jgi:hypothetical protein
VITRIWCGWTRSEDTDAYAEYIIGTGIAEYKATPGNRGAYLISRPDGERKPMLDRLPPRFRLRAAWREA